MKDVRELTRADEALRRDAEVERKADDPEGQALVHAIIQAMFAYAAFLDRRGVIFEDSEDINVLPRLKASALIAEFDFGSGDHSVNVYLKDGPTRRLFGDGVNPDPEGRITLPD